MDTPESTNPKEILKNEVANTQEGRRPTSELPPQETNETGIDEQIQSVEGELHKIVESKTSESEPKKSDGNKKIAWYGDFNEFPLTDAGKIVLPPDLLEQVNPRIEDFKKKTEFNLPSLMKGAKTAARYDTKSGQYSTRTEIVTLQTKDGKDVQVFVVRDYPLSTLHRVEDGMLKDLSGVDTYKASRREWKQVYEGKSQVPIIQYEDSHVVLMPFIENVNAFDVLTRLDEIRDVEDVPWLKDLDKDGLNKLGQSTVTELKRIHDNGVTWGESIINNLIFDKDANPLFVDAENKYKDDIPVDEQKARDLRDLVFSFTSNLLDDNESIDAQRLTLQNSVHSMLDAYDDPQIIDLLKDVVSRKPSLIQKFFITMHDNVRLSIKNDAVRENITKAVMSYPPAQKTA